MENQRSGSVEEALVKRRHDGAIATVTLNRPAQFNALSEAMIEALHATLDAASREHGCSVIVLAAEGRAFCAGHDLREMRARPEHALQRALFDRCSRLMLHIAELPQPVIARVHGIATAAGCQLVASCDLAIAARSARFATSGINLGLFCSTPAVALNATLTAKRASEMLLTGAFVDADTAERWGLINRAVDDGALEAETQAMAALLASKSPHALASGKRLLRQLRRGPSATQYELASNNMACDMDSRDAQAGIDAFIHKQPMPTWSGG
ncbi:MAG: enoyl-CoA hydratase [Burkholderiales bacterium]|nr:enoyl-CoA hydratase [Pseudomonadota bacterium]MCC7069113.1 enoyl-CoA hydratase [Burkholderiales bacterium]MCZ2133928.1 enoyl-CoA hydratase [Burkholderiales bacterium]